MKKAGVWTILLAVILAGCAVTQVTRPGIEDSAIISAPLDKVWGAIIATIGDRALPFESVEKESGLITTKFVIFTSGMVTDEQIDRIAVKPSGLLNVWSQGRYTLNIFAMPSGEGATKVKITTHIEAYERNVSNSWHICYSHGVLEQELLYAIRSKVTGVTIETKPANSVVQPGKIGI